MPPVRVFLCFLPQQEAEGIALSEVLRAHGCSVYYLMAQEGATEQTETYQAELNGADVFLPLLSRIALRSPRMRVLCLLAHTRVTMQHHLRLVPVWTEPHEMSDVWPFLRGYAPISGSTPATFTIASLGGRVVQELVVLQKILGGERETQVCSASPA